MADSSQNITQALLASRETALPVTLTLGEQVLEIQTLLRFMPARRAVYAGALDGKPVIIKLFSSHPRSRREYRLNKSGWWHWLKNRCRPLAYCCVTIPVMPPYWCWSIWVRCRPRVDCGR